MPFFLAMLTGMIVTDVPESATKTSYLLPGLPRTLPLIFGDDLYFLSVEIWTLFIISVRMLGAGILAWGSTASGERFMEGDVAGEGFIKGDGDFV